MKDWLNNEKEIAELILRLPAFDRERISAA
jgi:hypothetical protein